MCWVLAVWPVLRPPRYRYTIILHPYRDKLRYLYLAPLIAIKTGKDYLVYLKVYLLYLKLVMCCVCVCVESLLFLESLCEMMALLV